MKNYIKLISFLAFTFFSVQIISQTTEKKVVLQGFWWDYRNDNHITSWANYLTELAPRLKEMGIDAIWIPPSYKNTGTNSVGYSPFDHYDLGDKYQKGSTRTRVGTKDELLRMIAVMHANGIEVVQDVVLNHVDGAGAANGSGGQDTDPTYSMQSNGGYKNFRYVSYATPAPNSGNATTNQYWSRTGRWPKNAANFHPHAGHNVQNDDWTQPFWGPDFCFGYSADGTGNGHGQSSNATCTGCYNPNQPSGYTRDQARSWLQWLVKQTDVDGFRWDAVKHFPHFIVQDLSYNVKYLNGWASRGENMLNFAEYVAGGATLDNYVNDVTTSNGGSEELIGTKDFGLRGAFYGIISGSGFYDLSQVPGSQQNRRVVYYPNSNTYIHRTIPFVNNHDTFRPTFDSDGNINGWNTGDELAPHIDPNDPRLSVVYALTFALDGSPLIFFEDIFNMTNSGNRFSHIPSDENSLPHNTDIENIIWAHQSLDFKSGPYKVRGHNGNTGDHLIIERSGKAIISVNDNWNTWQSDWVDSDFPPGTVLKDYGNSNGNTTTVQNDQRVQISTPPCDGSATRRGYAIWAPIGQDNATYSPPRNPRTTQEWEMADDLGDSHCNSLGQGGRLPNNSMATRTVGKVFSAANEAVDIEIYGQTTNSITLEIYNLTGTKLYEKSGATPLTADYTPTSDDWIILKVRNTEDTYNGQKCWVKVSYTAPQVVNTSEKTPELKLAIWNGASDNNWLNCANWEEGIIPNGSKDAIILSTASNMPIIQNNVTCKNLMIENGATLTVDDIGAIRIRGNLTVNGSFNQNGCPLITIQEALNDTSKQTLKGNLDFCHLKIRNNYNVILDGDLNIQQTLELTSGKLEMNNYSVFLNENATITGANESRYLIMNSSNTASNYLSQFVNNDEILFPIGTNESYTPIFIQNTQNKNIKARVFESVYEQGSQGMTISNLDSLVNRTWEIASDETIAPMVKLQWNEIDENPNFNREKAVFLTFESGGWKQKMATSTNIETSPFSISSQNAWSDVQYITIAPQVESVIFPDDSSSNRILLFPNPTNGQITLDINHADFDNQNDEVTLNIFSINGKFIYSTSGLLNDLNNELTSKVSTLYNGVYIFEISFKEEKERVKILKK